LSRDLVVYVSVVGSCLNLHNCACFHDWFGFILPSVIHVVSGFLAKICLLIWNKWMKN